MVEDVRSTREQQPEGVGQKGRGRGAVAAQVYLDRLDCIFTIAPGTIEVLIEHGRRGGVQGRHDKTGIIPRAHDFRLEHHAPGLGPGARRIAKFVIEPATRRRCLAMSPGQGDSLVVEMTRGLDGGRCLAEQDGVAREAKDKICPAVGGDHVDDLGSRKMTIAAD